MPDEVFYPILLMVGILLTGFILGIQVGRLWEAEVRAKKQAGGPKLPFWQIKKYKKVLDRACGLCYNIRMKTKKYVLYAKAGVLRKTRKLLGTGSRAFLESGVAIDRIDPRKVGIVSKDFWENVLQSRQECVIIWL